MNTTTEQIIKVLIAEKDKIRREKQEAKTKLHIENRRRQKATEHYCENMLIEYLETHQGVEQ